MGEDALVADLIGIDEARRRVLAVARPLAAEEVALDQALGRVLAEEVTSPTDVPPFASSAMDGFAVAPGAEGDLRVVGESRAGSPSPVPVGPGAAVRISTGALVPEGTGTVVPLEQTEPPGAPPPEGGADRGGELVRVLAPAPGANIRLPGEDLRAGQTVLGPGAELGPAALGVLASGGRAAVRCARSPRVAILATGDELVAPGGELAPGGIWSSNPVALAAQAALAGAETEPPETVPDAAVATRSALLRALGAADVVCVSGGVSVGPHDHVKGALAALGAEQRFWGVALRPGKPTWFGTYASSSRRTLVFGLPGNPVSAMVTFQLFVRPALRALQGADPAAERSTAVLDTGLARNPTRAQAVRCRLRTEGDGLHAVPTGPQGSHVLTSMLAADGLALVAAGAGELAAGERVEVELLRCGHPRAESII